MDLTILKKRRKNLLQMIDDGIVILPTSPEYYRNRDSKFPYRADSDFYYLTHFPEPEAVAVLEKSSGKFILFCRDKDPLKEQWDGYRIGQDEAITQFGADEAYSFNDIDVILPKLMQNQSRVYCTLGRYPVFDKQLIEYLNDMRGQNIRNIQVPLEFVDVGHILHEMRLFKKPDERKIMKKAAKITSMAHIEAIKQCKPGMYEYELQGVIESVFMKNGSRFPAYQSIVAGGKNACVLHYVENNQPLQDGDLVLVDAGAEYQYYAGDITRTYPVNGKFNDAQKAIYSIVLEAHEAAIAAVKPNNHWNQPHETALRIITQGLIKLGIIKGKADKAGVDKAIKEELYKPFFMHRTGHWLGMDVHDVGDYKVDNQWRILEPGMALTIEPGIYIPATKDIAKKWHHIGVRIEDNVIVTKNGHEVITNVPTAIDEIEALMAKNK